ncbi:LysR family transcriptional regulator [Photobacterium sanguinicancri]|uniref:LysR family transcriptional regulator n=1 Tax=Photobacterium sanguinicancri TaxID=875932 RepID=A0AAW7Y425_9GAMM|nr:LysR family transcriptional regulator [Photobacterium sanguinicancri]KXI22162.1 LysR family transcriptional regulator [Photobacterium sanguinicancri]MDO6499558.1 LysR family transcriptional regulator [Photobacterium sanguinicancri]MDO6542516.1 LysR family transcriptional regulator [Photobacterium sanguinicancri]OZS45606.1 LysR family transcriptional regulator [Photobacterium sanguinicancri]
MKLDDLNLFRVVVEQGSYTAASRKTQVPVATLTRRIQALEECLSIRLLNRHARKLSLTEAGQRFYDDCSPLLAQLVTTTQHISEECKGAAGKLRIAAPSNLTKVMLQPLLNAFMKEHPAINLELHMSSEPEQLDPTDWDAIFRVGPQRDSTLIARKISSVKDILVASPLYLKGHPAPKHAQELHEHTLLKGNPLLRWRLIDNQGEAITINDPGRFEANQLNVVRKACCAGLGITLMPDVMLEQYIESGELVQILKNWSANPREVFLLYNHRDYQPEKLRLFIEFSSHYFELS